MTDVEHIQIVRHAELTEIETTIAELASTGSISDSKLRKRLEFVRLRYRGYPVLQAADILGINPQSGYNWQKAWNEGGMRSLVPRFSGGRPPRMDEAQKERLLAEIEKEPMTTHEVMRFIQERFRVTYSEKQVHVILSGMGLRHAKPYQKDYRQPKDAEARLKKTSPMVWLV
jgi:putative transposase